MTYVQQNCMAHGIHYSWRCPKCYPEGPALYVPTVPPGCICPPTSEQTCQSKACPRRDHGDYTPAKPHFFDDEGETK